MNALKVNISIQKFDHETSWNTKFTSINITFQVFRYITYVHHNLTVTVDTIISCCPIYYIPLICIKQSIVSKRKWLSQKDFNDTTSIIRFNLV